MSGLRVLLAHDRLGYSGAGLHGGGRFMLECARGLRSRGVGVDAVVLRSTPNVRAIVDAEGQPIRFLDRRAGDPRTLSDLVRLIRDQRIDLLHLQGHGSRTLGRIAAALTRRPAIVHLHADYRFMPKGYPWFVGAADRQLAARTARALIVSEALREFATRLMGFRAEQVEVWHNPVDRRRFPTPSPDDRRAARAELGLAEGAPVAVTVGRLDRLKGVDVQLEAWPAVRARAPGAVLLVVGDGPERAALEHQAARECGAGVIRFLGHCPDVSRVLWAADLAVLSARLEGLPLVVPEAMSTGLPVVATAVGGIPEVVAEGTNGLLVPPDRAESLALAVARVFTEAGLREHLAAGASRTAESLNLPSYAARLENTYREVVAAGRARSRS